MGGGKDFWLDIRKGKMRAGDAFHRGRDGTSCEKKRKDDICPRSRQIGETLRYKDSGLFQSVAGRRDVGNVDEDRGGKMSRG